jgi:hypothetical protein
VTIASPRVFEALGIRHLIYLSGEFESNSSELSSLVKKGEAIIIRSNKDLGIQAELEWFRGIFTFSNLKYSYSRTAGLPGVERAGATSIISKRTWDLVNEKGRVRRDLLELLLSRKIGESHMLVSNQTMLQSRLSDRLLELGAENLKNNEIYAWEIFAKQPVAAQDTLLVRAWLAVFGQQGKSAKSYSLSKSLVVPLNRKVSKKVSA